MNTESNRLRGIDWLIILLASATGIIHLVIGFGQLGSGGFLPIAFILNGLAYLGLVVAAYFLGAFRPYHSALQWALVALAAVTIVSYFIFNGVEGLSNPLGIATKIIELVLIVALIIDLRR